MIQIRPAAGVGHSVCCRIELGGSLDMSAASNKVLTHHDEIQEWAEEHDAQPSEVKGTGNPDDPGVLRFDFPGFSGSKLEHISWDAFFKKFDENNLALVIQETTADGKQSNFNKLVKRETASKKVA
jgi:hypothetical protein